MPALPLNLQTKEKISCNGGSRRRDERGLVHKETRWSLETEAHADLPFAGLPTVQPHLVFPLQNRTFLTVL